MGHPYYPVSVELPGFQQQTVGLVYIFSAFFGVLGWIALCSLILAGRVKYLSTRDRLMIIWFMCSGFIHVVIEGHVVLRGKFYQDTTGNWLDEAWKEYSKADSRYATRDSFVVTMEGVTAFLEGPACFLIVFGMLTKKSWRYTAILLTSLGQFYGDVLYFLTCWHEGFTKHSRPEALYFWGYFIILNSVWLIIPFSCMVYAARKVALAVARDDLSQQQQKIT